nr:hypothetical protein [Actinoplanes sp. NBRC 103695]
MDDPDVEVLDEYQDVGSGDADADADVAELSGDAQGDGAGFVDRVVADPVVGVAGAVGAGNGFGAGLVGGGRGGPVGRRPVGRWLYSWVNTSISACSWVMVPGWGVWARSHFLRVCWKRSTLPQVVGWFVSLTQ